MHALPVVIAVSLLLAGAADVEMPRVVDPRLAIDLVAAEPELVTPTGIAVDAQGRVLVIESHTHFRPEGYTGPPADRIRVFEDFDGHGKARRVSTFFEGTRFTMNLAVYRDGSVFVATRYEVFRLYDEDADGKSDRKRSLVRLETPGDYPHNGLSGCAFDFQGNVYFGLGENLGADYRLVGNDGVTLSGGGEGGNIYRCRPDGTGLERIATGFWNPFHMAFDAFGRLFAVDNDPDSRPPCRLLHIVEGGDYGYRFRNGRKGLHPFTAWNGELPGTLPMLAGTGEAPSGVLAYESDLLPADFRGSLFVTSWGDHRIERYRLATRGASFRSVMEPLVQGGENFRPVGIAQAPDGTVFISDWVDKSYPLHGKGRIWRLRSAIPPAFESPTSDEKPTVRELSNADRGVRERAARALAADVAGRGRQELSDALSENVNPRARTLALQALVGLGDRSKDSLLETLHDDSAEVRALAVRLLPGGRFSPRSIAATDPSPAVRAEALRRIADAEALDVLLEGLGSSDPFLALAARQGLKQSIGLSRLYDLAQLENPAQRLGILLVLRDWPDPAARRTIPAYLDDPDAAIRFAAIEWIGDQKLTEFRELLLTGLSRGAVTRQLFEAYLAALERLEGTARSPKEEFPGEDYVARLVADPAANAVVRRRALRALRPDHPVLTMALLNKLLAAPDLAMRLEAVRTLRESPHSERIALLASLARNVHAPPALRAEAIAGLSGDTDESRSFLVALALDADPDVRHEALRSLRGAALSAEQRARLAQGAPDDASRALVAFLADPPKAPSQASDANIDAWLQRIDDHASAAEGERIFFHPKGPGCFRCHQVDGRGGRGGPDLSTTGQVVEPRRLVESILQPSKEIAPQFVAWLIAKKDGTVMNGVLLGETPEGDQTYADAQGHAFTLSASQIEDRKPLPTSIMPDDLAKTLTPQEFSALIAFLRHPRRDEAKAPEASNGGERDSASP